MRIGIGIDTGGTYTDAVLYDLDENRVLSGAKALTTREDLSIGIGEALGRLDPVLAKEACLVALSTTLATNACVEDKGGRAKLLFINIPQKTVDWVGGEYGLRDKSAILCCEGEGARFDGSVAAEPDWERLIEDGKAWLSDAEGLAIVELYAMNNGGIVEKKAKELFSAICDVPIICGSELFQDLNSIKRGASTLLNARLVPILRDFMLAIRKVLSERGISASTLVVRSDATVMSDEFALLRPVETILCGPAASVLGGAALTEERDCVIVDMGGTTTDVSIVKGGKPVTETDGVRVGNYSTYVKGVFTDTFALGGDSAIRMLEGNIALQQRRVTPLCIAAQKWGSIKDELKKLIERAPQHTKPLHEFLYAVKNIEGNARYTARERDFVSKLWGKALPLEEAAKCIGERASTFNIDRLENENIIMRAGFTPTDAMHVVGDFSRFDAEASRLAAEYFSMTLSGRTADEMDIRRLCGEVYDAVKEKLYANIVRILLKDSHPKIFARGMDGQISDMIRAAWRGDAALLDFRFTTGASLVSIGAPTHVFLPDVAKKLATKCVVPEYAAVANAVGAITGRVSAQAKVKIVPDYKAFGVDGYIVQGSENVRAETMQEAISLAKADAHRSVVREARLRGLSGAPRIEIEVSTASSRAREGQVLDMGTLVVATASAES
ncbi:MAG: hydantoinase/oxoprolinase family protein [Christensenellales bacterium]